MIRNTLMLPVLALLAASSVLGADIPFSARVDVLQMIDIAVADFDGPATSSSTLSMHGTQDQCLDLRWVDGGGTATARETTVPAYALAGLFRLGEDGYGIIDPGSDGVPEGSTLQINLN